MTQTNNSHPIAQTLGWKVGVDYPEWGNNPLYLTTIKGGYLYDDKETPMKAYIRLAQTAAGYLGMPELEKEFLNILVKGWLIPSSPVMSNFGNSKGLPVSCFGGTVGDSIYEIGRKNLELMLLSKAGGGTSYDFSKIRPIGSPIQKGVLGTSDGIIPFAKMYDSTIISSKQGKTRRGAVALYLDVDHPEVPEFLKIRQPAGNEERQCHNIHHGINISDDFMSKVVAGPGKERDLWLEIQKTRVKSGEPYIMFTDNANRNLHSNWKEHNLRINHSNLCSEIMLPDDEEHTFVCVLSSLNLYKYDEWKSTEAIFYATLFLDAVVSEFIEKGSKIKGIEDSVRFAEKSRALGLGALGWHSYLQSKGEEFTGLMANSLTRLIFKDIKSESNRASKYLASKLGEPEWLEGTGYRHLTLTAIAPNRSSAKLAGGLSQGVEPIAANLFIDNDAKGTHIIKNPELQKLFISLGRDIKEVWDYINEMEGSVQGLNFLTDDQKKIFLTFKEINQLELVRQACIRQEYISQGQSINLSFTTDTPANFINKVHMEAWKGGLKALYYLKSGSVVRADTGNKSLFLDECVSCEA